MPILRHLLAGAFVPLLALPLACRALESLPVSALPALGDPPKLKKPAEPSAPMQLSAVQNRTGLVVDINNRQQARAFYNSVFLGSSTIAADWSGDVATCVAGDTASAYKQRVMDRINYYRAVAGVPADIQLNPDFSGKSQAAALIMSANSALSHTPPTTWNCWSADGNTAAGKSNLSLGSAGPDAIQGYVQDRGNNNQAVGHRRWILYPQTQEMGTGDVVPPTTSGIASNALWVIDSHTWDVRPNVRDEFVAWPPPGFVPYQTVYPRWSFSHPDADFSNAQVRMSQNGNQVPLSVHPIQPGYGENSIVWVPDGLDPASQSTAWPAPEEDTTYLVNITGVLINGETRAFQYEVTVFSPDTPGADEEQPVISGDRAIPVTLASQFQFTPISFSDAHHLAVSTLTDSATQLNAETVDPLIQDLTDVDYPLIQNQIVKSGNWAYHLAHPNAQSQALVIDQEFLLSADSQLIFASRLATATEHQLARVEISLNGGVAWQTLYQQAGSNNSGESGFVQRVIDLAEFAGKSARFRFVYYFDQGSYYSGTSAGIGWYLDDIEFVATRVINDTSISVLNGSSSFVFTPTAERDYLLQVRGLPWPAFAGMEWGPGKVVKALDPTTDNDQDLMFDLWELNHNLDPDNPSDAVLDSDNDGVSNLREHDANTDPQDPESYPGMPGEQKPWLKIMPWLELLLSE